MYTNAKRQFAVWWEPKHDSQIDQDAAGYVKMLGERNYLATAPRVQDWNEFKETIIKFENGEMKGERGELSNEMKEQMAGFFDHLEKKSKKNSNSGCMLAIIVLVSIVGIVGTMIS
jgi:hypothetical protein